MVGTTFSLFQYYKKRYRIQTSNNRSTTLLHTLFVTLRFDAGTVYMYTDPVTVTQPLYRREFAHYMVGGGQTYRVVLNVATFSRLRQSHSTKNQS